MKKSLFLLRKVEKKYICNGYIFEGEDLQNIGYANWGAGQPDNKFDAENCGSMKIDGEIYDFPCDTPAVFFCEISNKRT